MIPTDASAANSARDPAAGVTLRAAARQMMRVMLALAQESAAGAARMTADADARAGWQELRNKLEAFRTFEHVDALIGLPMTSPLPQLVERAGGLRLPLRVWAVEGMGYHAAAVRGAAIVHGSLRGFLQHGDLPAWAGIPLHAGMGSAIAAGILDHVAATHPMPGRGLGDAVDRFIAACVENAERSHLAVALEALGFVVRGMDDALLPRVAEAIERRRPALLPYFWHGVGRASYFAPGASFAGSGLQEGLHEARRLAAGEPRRNAIAGVCWAAALVNLGHPHVLERLVLAMDTPHASTDACAAGVRDALDAWRRCAPRDRALADLAAHEPACPAVRAAWVRVIAPAAAASATSRSTRVAGDLFAVRPVSASDAAVFAGAVR